MQDKEPSQAESGQQSPKHAPRQSQKRLCGLTVRQGVLVLVVTVIAVSAIMGGVIGGVKASKNGAIGTTSSAPAISGSTTTSPTSSTSRSGNGGASKTGGPAAPSPLSTSGILALDCPGLNGTQRTTPVGGAAYAFLVLCQTDLVSGSRDIDSSLQYSLDGCLDHCAARNGAAKLPQCQGLTWDANLTKYGDFNCFLKTTVTARKPYTGDQVQAGAVLLNLDG